MSSPTDFFTVEVCSLRGLVTHYVLFFIDIGSRAVNIAGITAHPDGRWMTQIARNVTDLNCGFLCGKRHLILDRDTKYCDAFRSILVREGIEVIRLPPRAPNLNAFAEAALASPSVCTWSITMSYRLRAAHNAAAISLVFD